VSTCFSNFCSALPPCTALRPGLGAPPPRGSLVSLQAITSHNDQHLDAPEGPVWPSNNSVCFFRPEHPTVLCSSRAAPLAACIPAESLCKRLRPGRIGQRNPAEYKATTSERLSFAMRSLVVRGSPPQPQPCLRQSLPGTVSHAPRATLFLVRCCDGRACR
jgi:hypothetical protein